MKRAIVLPALLLAALMVSAPSVVSAASAQTQTSGLYSRLKTEQQTYAFDFSDTRMSYYMTHEALTIDNRTAMAFKDGALYSRSHMSFGSSVFVGDDYGLSEGYVSFDLQLSGGALSLGTRLTDDASTPSSRGVWFSFEADGTLNVTEPISGLSGSIATGADFSKAVKIRVEEKLSSLLLYVGGELTASVTYISGGKLTLLDKSGAPVASVDENDLYSSGYFTLYFNDTDGYVDNLEFTNFKVDQTQPDAQTREIDYSTWIATDDLERTTATNETAGDTRQDKYVGLFYFLCWTGAGIHVQDNTAIYLQSGVDGLKTHLEKEGGESYWSQPYFGYYTNTDTWVYRKHAYMLEAAGVDFIFLDVSNGVTYNEGHLALFDTWLQIRKEGGMTPQIVFFCGDRSDVLNTDIANLKKTVYSAENYEKYKELFFMWDGKPLIFGNTLSDSSGTLTSETKEFLKDFTVRANWAWADQDGYWSWLQEYSITKSGKYKFSAGGRGRDLDGNFEELSICLGHHASTSKGRSYYLGDQPATGENDFNFTLGTSGDGICFESQFNAAMQFDPTVLLITGWNEWIAGCFHDSSNTFFASTKVNGYLFVDQFNTEFSRDAEPMRLRDGVGFGDNYYYQMVDYIRKFKGFPETTKADGQKSIKLTDISYWDEVTPEYRDSTGDVELRNSRSYDNADRYVNGTGRNDFDYAKVSQDGENLYFMVKCTSDIQTSDGENWMNLFLNTDLDNKTGWEGYDYIVNRSRTGSTVSVEKFNGTEWTSTKVADASYVCNGQYMVIKVAKADLGVKDVSELYFKWADNSTDSGDVMAFMDLGDAAPNDRYAYRYLGYAGESTVIIEDTTASLTDDETAGDTTGGEEESENLADFILTVVGVSVIVIGLAVGVIIVVKRRK